MWSTQNTTIIKEKILVIERVIENHKKWLCIVLYVKMKNSVENIIGCVVHWFFLKEIVWVQGKQNYRKIICTLIIYYTFNNNWLVVWVW